MPVTAYTGLPGSGKSHSVVEFVVLPAIKAGRVVVTNLALKLDVLAADFPAADVRLIDSDSIKADPEYLHSVAVAGSVLVIDEAQLVWPSGARLKDVPKNVLSFFTEHRHRVDAKGRASDIVLVTQDLGNVATFARNLVAYTFRSVALDDLGSSSRFRVDVYKGPASGPSPPEKTRNRQIFGKYREEVWRYYTSHTQREGQGTAVDESGLDKRNVVWRSPWLIGGAIAALVMGVYGVIAVWGVFSPEQEQGERAGGALPAPASASPPGRAVPVQHIAMSRWRITGEISGGLHDVVMLTDGLRSVTLPTERYCDRDVTGYLICQWDGAEVSNQIRVTRLPPQMASAAPDTRSPP